MICIREFEIYKSDGFFIAEPFDTEGGAFGESFEGAIRSASNWLRETALNSMAHGRLVQGGKLHGTLSNNGLAASVSVVCHLSRTNAVTAADAALFTLHPLHKPEQLFARVNVELPVNGLRMRLDSVF